MNVHELDVREARIVNVTKTKPVKPATPVFLTNPTAKPVAPCMEPSKCVNQESGFVHLKYHVFVIKSLKFGDTN